MKLLDNRCGSLSGFERAGTGARGHRNEMVPPGPNRGKPHPTGWGWWPSRHRPIDHGRKARASRSLYCQEALGHHASVVSHAVGTLSGVCHHEGHEEHEGREKHVKIRSLFYSCCPFLVSFVRFVVNRKTLVEHRGGGCAAYQRDDNLQ